MNSNVSLTQDFIPFLREGRQYKFTPVLQVVDAGDIQKNGLWERNLILTDGIYYIKALFRNSCNITIRQVGIQFQVIEISGWKIFKQDKEISITFDYYREHISSLLSFMGHDIMMHMCHCQLKE